ncbi:hypothetical protein BDP81DRAFT_54506 [Colletotrichum phormii]|uniref:Uncharacterized protein n=1 Tax=Colletotrichum phormii TaxID=359342 RepID=A0AAI9ZMT8_9PEZI|nr:uncharacterized protein BDP81DRAFT_54506 [Colletotrichum phormii]KAK1634902.1 hypothetical protein BDP81DRAFT_54506 [Colletotrichum phormii]
MVAQRIPPAMKSIASCEESKRSRSGQSSALHHHHPLSSSTRAICTIRSPICTNFPALFEVCDDDGGGTVCAARVCKDEVNQFPRFPQSSARLNRVSFFPQKSEMLCRYDMRYRLFSPVSLQSWSHILTLSHLSDLDESNVPIFFSLKQG